MKKKTKDLSEFVERCLDPEKVSEVKGGFGKIIIFPNMVTTKALGEEDDVNTTTAIGEEDDPVTTTAVGEEDGPMTTMALGEEG